MQIAAKFIANRLCKKNECLIFVNNFIFFFLLISQVDTEVCEQTSSWLSCYGKMTRRMNLSTYLFFLLYICNLHNIRETETYETNYTASNNYYIIITIVQSYTGKYHEFVAVCIVMSAQHE